MSEAISKLEPHRTLYLRGFDRRGAVASLHSASSGGFTVSGAWADTADFAVLTLYDADDNFGHLFTTKYLPDFTLTGVTLDFDLAVSACQNPISNKFQSVPWGAISYITSTEHVSGTSGYPNIELQPCATSATGMVAASCTYAVGGTGQAGDRIELVYMSNVVWDYLVTSTLPSAPSTVTFAFFNSFGTGYTHFITIGSSTYNYVQLAGDSSGAIATALALAVNAGPDPNATATASTNSVVLTAANGTGSVACAASDGNGSALLPLFEPPMSAVSAAMAAFINGTDWLSIGPTLALMAVPSGANFTVYGARYGKVSTAGMAVTFSTGQNFLGCNAGDPIVINKVPYTIGTVNSPTSITLTTSAGTQGPKAYLAPGGGRDGNGVELLSMAKTGTLVLTPAVPITSGVGGTTCQKLTGGVDPTSVHFHIDFTALGIDSVRQLWLTFGPPMKYDSSATNPTLVSYTNISGCDPATYPVTWSAVFANWTLADPGTVLPLKIAGPGSVTLGSRDSMAAYSGTSWTEQAGFYYQGFGRISAHATDTVTIKYSCQFSHDLYIGTSLMTSGGTFTTKLDGVTKTPVDTYANAGTPIQSRRVVAAGVAAGAHTLVLTISGSSNPLSSGTNCFFDYLQAAVKSDVQAPGTTYSGVSCACDFDTAQTYAISPARALWVLTKAGFTGDVDFYAGVFFALIRTRYGGHFHSAVVTISAGGSGFNLGTSNGDGDAAFLQVGGNSYGDGLGTAFGVAIFPNDTVDTLACRFVNAINGLFVGIRAEYTGTGQLTITTLSPVIGFTLFSTYTAGTGPDGASPSTGSISFTGDIGVGNEGVWQVDATQTQPLNQGFVDYLTDFCAQVHGVGQTMTVAYSQELLAPPDANTSSGAWSQRFVDGTSVLTSTGFGSWGAGVVDGVSGSGPQTIQQTGHGYITGNTVHIAQGANGAVWLVTVTDGNHYQLTTLVSGASFTVAAGATALIDLQTSQCCFNPATVTAYLVNVYKQTAGIMNTAGLTPWLQFGEVLWWFFSRYMSELVGFASFTSPISIGTSAPHNFTTGERVIVAGVQGNTASNGDQTITVTDSTHFTENGTSGNGNYVSATGTVSGGGMAYYDANTAAAALTALGRALATFYHQDDDPAVNGGADASFLAGLLKAHIDAIRTAVLGTYSNAKFELLFPYDVNFGTAYYTAALPFPQGGRLNRAVNFPTAYQSQSGSGIDRLKLEALSWGATYRNLTNAQAAITFPFTSPCSWPVSATAYLVPWFNGGCPWPTEYLTSKYLPLLNFWAVDHLVLFSWPVPLPVASGTIFIGAPAN